MVPTAMVWDAYCSEPVSVSALTLSVALPYFIGKPQISRPPASGGVLSTYIWLRKLHTSPLNVHGITCDAVAYAPKPSPSGRSTHCTVTISPAGSRDRK